MTFLKRIRYGFKLIGTRALWGPRLAHLGTRSSLGRPRRSVCPRSIWVGDHVTICDGWFMADLDPSVGPGQPKIRIGDWCTILDDFQCNAAISVEIEEYVLIASRVFVSDSDHVVDPRGERTTRCRRLISQSVVIEHDCWIGQNAVILKGVRLGHHSVVAAGAVVTKSFPACSIVGGVPAAIIGSTLGHGPEAEQTVSDSAS